jgi:hypothetical protein
MSKRTRRNARSKSRHNKRRSRKQRGGGMLPIPRGAVAVMSLDPKDIYGVPVAVSKEMAEEQILDN